MLKQFIIVGLGGGIGSMIRYALYYIIKPALFPVATLLINISGSLLIGLVIGLALKQVIGDDWKLFLATGVCGGFTTFSAFSYENLELLQNGKIMTALLYIGVSLIAGIGAAWIGLKMAS